jgi:hypothetical protein
MEFVMNHTEKLLLETRASIVDPFWSNSKFEFTRSLSSKQKGTFGEKLVSAALKDLGLNISKRYSSDHDIVVEDFSAEVKMSTAWNNKLDDFKWQQIRNQDYDLIFFLGINPNDFTVWWATKNQLIENVIGKDEYRQHAGKDGHQELYWITGYKDWFNELSDLKSVISSL